MPHGVFVLADEADKLRIKGISQNCPQFFKKEAGALLGTSLLEVVCVCACVYVCADAGVYLCACKRTSTQVHIWYLCMQFMKACAHIKKHAHETTRTHEGLCCMEETFNVAQEAKCMG
jgi:hypothetical protein